MAATFTRREPWTVAAVSVGSPDAAALLREYLIDVSDSYHLLHLGRRSTPVEIDQGLAENPSDDLTPPSGLFLIGRHNGRAAACAGLRILDPRTVELTRVFVRPELRGSGGGATLLSAVDEAAIRLGANRIVLDTRLDLIEARALYVKHGYTEIPAYKRGPYSEIWYGKHLGDGAPNP